MVRQISDADTNSTAHAGCIEGLFEKVCEWPHKDSYA